MKTVGGLLMFAVLWQVPLSAEAQSVGTTEALCVLAGPGDVRTPGQENLDFYGTDLGYNYAHQGRIEFLFGDTWANAFAGPVDGFVPRDDVYASVDLSLYPDGDAAEAACAAGEGMLVFGTYSNGLIATLNPGVPLELLKTPLAAFSNGTQEYAVFITGKPIGCRNNGDCGGGFVCDPGLGFAGEEYYDDAGLTLPCIDGTFGCLNNTMAFLGFPIPGTGFCTDPTSSVATPDDAGRLASVVVRHKIGVRKADKRDYFSPHEWKTNRFLNAVAATVNDFDPGRSGGAGNDYTTADGVNPATEKLLIWGRPSFGAVGAEGRNLRLYLAYTNMPAADGAGNFGWSPKYFTGFDAQNRPTFSSNQRDAVPLDLSGGAGDPDEIYDLVQQMSVRYVPLLGKWVMLYGGGGYMQGFGCLLVPCDEIEFGNGAVRMRTADHPWGPWSLPQDVLASGHPDDGPVPGSQYAPGGLLRHPDCADAPGAACAVHSPGYLYTADEHGFFYAATIIEPWTEARPGGAVDLYWNVSTWDPYYVYLLKTRIDP